MQIGHGMLTLGADTELVNMSASVSEVRLVPEVQDETRRTAQGHTIPSGQVTTWTLEGEVFTSWELVDFLDENQGYSVPFRFVPSNREGREITGHLVPAMIEVGGTPGTRARAPFEWAVYCPVFGEIR